MPLLTRPPGRRAPSARCHTGDTNVATWHYLTLDLGLVWSAGQDVVEFRNGMVNVVAAHGAVPKVNNAGEIYAPVWSVIRELWEPYVFVPQDRGYVAYRFGQGASSYTDGANNDYGEAACRWINDPVNGDWGGGFSSFVRPERGL
ncbi:MAG: hypothetical protein HS102_19030 [Planctomycetia bacterium]|nr:hypothetical protein [Planctomycetia bacterium]